MKIARNQISEEGGGRKIRGGEENKEFQYKEKRSKGKRTLCLPAWKSFIMLWILASDHVSIVGKIIQSAYENMVCLFVY